ncbi:MAG: PQQ-binding-like beta-propeller repeat protein, partial [Spirochaetota bacterium]|nr:PQQ-binding-like beta-propeller repeat protein [Spirochaetota bacterium]
MLTVLKIMGKVKIRVIFLLFGIGLFLQTASALSAQENSFSEARWKKPTGGRVLSVSPSHRYRWIYALSEDRTLHCITPAGTLLWQSERLPNRPTGNAVVGPDESLYVHTSRGDLYAFNPA